MEASFNPNKSKLAEIFKETGAFQRGHFTLASGKESNVYVDCRLATLDDKGLDEISNQLLLLMQKHNLCPTHIGGVTSGADPLVAGILLASRRSNPCASKMKGFFVRKEAKDHGTKKQIEGNLEAGVNCVILDDVATTGGSSQIAVDAAEKVGANVLAVIVVVDREQGAKQHFADQGIPLYSLLTLQELEELLA